jgi:acetolactate synthase-1/2/3 large subunit
MIFVGSGALHACDEILDLAELLDAPVVAFRSGRGIVSNEHELGLTMAAAYELWPKTDLMIGIGTRMELPGWRWSLQPPGLRSVRIDIDPAEFRRASPDVAILADAAEGARALAAACRRIRQSRPERRNAIRAADHGGGGEDSIRAAPDVVPGGSPGGSAARRDRHGRDGASGFHSLVRFPGLPAEDIHLLRLSGHAGSGFPTALGVKVAHPDRPVVAICGDGGFMFAVQELATAVQYGIDVVTLVFNNQAYGNVRRDQRDSFGGRVIASDLVNPDFVALARSFGVEAERVDSPDAFRPVLERALSEGVPG